MSRHVDPEADFKKAVALALETGQRVRDLRAALDHAEANPLEADSAEDYAASISKMKFALAKAADEANHANAAKDAASEALEVHRLKKAKAGEAPAVEAHNGALDALVSAAQKAAESLAPVLAFATSTRSARDAIRAQLREAGEPVSRDPRTSLAFDFPGLLDPRPGAAGALATAVRVVEWLESAPQREGEAKEYERRRELQRRQDVLNGHHGREAQEAAQAEVRKELRESYAVRAGAGAFAGALGTYAQGEIEVYRRNAGMKD